MFTPQQIDQISFGRSTFGGYDMQQVDEFLEPLTEDYVTLYKENALLKSKMRVLVGKLEEYRKNEASMKDAVINAQKTCDKMVAEAEAKCARMLNNASAAAAAPVAAPAAPSVSSDAMVAAESANKAKSTFLSRQDQRAAGSAKDLHSGSGAHQGCQRPCAGSRCRTRSGSQGRARPCGERRRR